MSLYNKKLSHPNSKTSSHSDYQISVSTSGNKYFYFTKKLLFKHEFYVFIRKEKKRKNVQYFYLN